MKCLGKKKDGSPCDYSQENTFEFCPDCGYGTVPGASRLVIPCPGKNNQCGSELSSDDRFCSDCGWKIDQKLFQTFLRKCTGTHEDGSPCKAYIKEGDKFCKQCGHSITRGVSGQTVQEDEKVLCNSPNSTNTESSEVTDENVTENLVEQSKSGSGNDGSQEEDSFQPETGLSTERNQLGQQTQSGNGSQLESTVADSTQEITGDASKTDRPREAGGGDSDGTSEDVQKGRKHDENVAETGSGNDDSNDEDRVQPETDLRMEGNQVGQQTQSDNGSQPETVADSSQEITDASKTDRPREAAGGDGTSEDVQKGREHDDNVTRDGSSVDEAPDTGTPDKVTTQAANTTDSANSQHDGESNSGQQDGSSNSQTQGTVTRNQSQKNNGKTKERQKTKDTNKNKSAGKKSDSKAVVTRGTKPDQKHQEDEFEVIFHAVISKDFKVKTEKDEVYLVIGCEPLGGWNSKKWKMTHVGCHQGYQEYSCKVTMTKSIRNGGFEYKYKVVSEARKEPFETVYFGKHRNGPVNRKFSVPKERRQITDPLHQYDGLVYPKPNDSLFKILFVRDGTQGRIVDDMKTVLSIFLPPPDQIISTIKKQMPVETDTAEALLQTVTDVFLGLSVQLVDFKNSNDVRQKIFMDFMQPLLDHLACVEHSHVNYGPVLLVFIMAAMRDNNITAFYLGLDKCIPGVLIRPDREKKSCPVLDSLHKHFPRRDTKDMVELMLRLIYKNSQVTITTWGFSYGDQFAESSWMYVVPLLHFLRKDSSPFVKPLTSSSSHRHEDWWGHKDITTSIDALKNSIFSIPITDIIHDLEYLFDVDYLLPRTIMASAKYKDLLDIVKLQKVPPEICSGTLYYFCRNPEIYLAQREMLYIATCIDEVAKKFKDERTNLKCPEHSLRFSQEDCTAHRKMCLRITTDLLELCLSNENQYIEMVEAVANLLASSVCECSSHDTKREGGQQTELQTDLSLVWFQLHDWMRQRITSVTDFWRYILGYNTLMHLDFGSDHLNTDWQIVLLDAAEDIFSKMSPERCYRVHMSCDSSRIHASLQERMTNAAFKSLESLIMVDDKIAASTPLGPEFGSLMSRLLEDHWPRDVDEEAYLHHVLTWKPLHLYFKRFLADDMSHRLLSVICTRSLETAVSLLKQIRLSLCDGNIPISQLKLIADDTERFLDLLTSSKVCDDSEGQVMNVILQIRLKELTVSKDNLKQTSVFLNYCKLIPNVNSEELSDFVRNWKKHIEADALSSVCQPLPREEAETTSVYLYQPTMRDMPVSGDVVDIIPHLVQLNDSLLFKEIWKKEARKVIHGSALEPALFRIWDQASSSWTDFCQRLIDGTHTFKTVQSHVKVLDGDFKKIEEEFKLVDKSCEESSENWVEKRLSQLHTYEKIQDCQNIAKLILDVKAAYCLQGDFAPVIKIKELAHREDSQMKKLDKNVLKACKILEGMESQEKQDCVKAFIDCKNLIDWVRESIPNGVKELKVFVDLAYISAGEKDFEIEKVNCFQTATGGYAPFIFHTPVESGYKTFLENCKTVWGELDTNNKLPEKLRLANQHLSWLQEVKQSHGSVEERSLTQADMINTRGVYRIGNLNVSDKALNNVISLHLSPEIEDKDNPVRKYTFDELVDLQSRLMLVAGQAEKGNENIGQYILVLDGIVRLAKTYIRLCSDGCVLFSSWKGEFICGQERKVCSVLEFGKGEKLKGHRGKENVTNFVHALANDFEKFHDEWMKYVCDERDEYLELNFYTIDQLVFLQRELIKLGTDEEPSVHVYSMLSLIKPDCTQADITGAMQTAKEAVFVKQEYIEKEIEVDKPLEDSDAKQVFIDAMIESNYSEKLAQLALEANDPNDIDSGIVWCMEHEDEISEEDDTFSGWTSDEHSMSLSSMSWVREAISSETRNDIDVKTLTSNLRSVWTKFLEAVSSSVADYLSLEHLGIILRQLAKTGIHEVKRTVPLPLKPRVPNLIVCPHDDMLNTVLYLYKHSMDQPLPQPDEVLLCTPQVTIDQVDIFLRRAFFSNSDKLYAMVNADLLQYEIEERAEKKIKEYSTRTNMKGLDYQLVILCSTENEFKARIVAALDLHKCPAPAMRNLDEIKGYLKSKFSQPGGAVSMTTASMVDFESSTVRVIKSKRAGVGKTLYKKRQVEALQRLNPGVPATSVSIHLYEKSVSTTAVAEKLLDHTLQPGQILPRIFHLDISYEVQEGVDYLLFNLLVLGCITNNMGHVWLKSPLDLYLVETIPITDVRQDRNLIHPLLEVLPDVFCWSPQESLQILNNGIRREEYGKNDSLFDDKEFESETFQRPYQYLKRWDKKQDLADIDASKPEGPPEDCLAILLKHCGLKDPSWSELHNFVCFLNTQLQDFEKSIFCSDLILEDLPGFPPLVLRFLIQMSKDFATRSLDLSEESPLAQKVHDDEEEDDFDGEEEDVFDGEEEDDFDGEEEDDFDGEEEDDEDDLVQFQMKRTWESSPHPFIFFNPDGHTMTFLGFNIDHFGNMIDPHSGQMLDRGLVPRSLQIGLRRNNVEINENPDQLNRVACLMKLCRVMPGVDFVHDPDDTYELTTDNVKKILAIYMRFRCGIPVIIMGETGCGKTRLVKFMCDLQCPPGTKVEKNMVIMKVHGGTTTEDIIKKVKQAEQLAIANKVNNPHMYTVLFFDEANTTEAIGLIKEIMCDGSMDGQPLKLSENLKIVAACNPYRKHSDDMIQRLEKAGLGYHVEARQTTDKLGHVPMRRLVYRVQPLPQSMLPLVWDFGQLNVQVEELYIRQMVNRYIRNGDIPDVDGLVEVVSGILIASQDFMRKQEDECSFVSLRDVDRTLSVMAWFYQQSQLNGILFKKIDEQISPEQASDDEEEEEEEEEISEVCEELICNETLFQEDDKEINQEPSKVEFPPVIQELCVSDMEEDFSFCLESDPISDEYIDFSVDDQEGFQEQEQIEEAETVCLHADLTKALILALSVCYRASLRSREEYDRHITGFFQHPCVIPGRGDRNQFVDIINSCQRVFVDEVQLKDNIAKNQALKENLFMMVVCIELRIPLFLVGKPGSSKSLAKTIVADAMQDNSSRSELFKQLKQAQMVSFQCSPLATAEGIVGTFRQCARYQQDKDLDKFASIVVLDEVGLAEDSPRMPLKTLHSLLEDGYQGLEETGRDKKVAFIGISNWALDPAKMNRGILVQREVPDSNELVESAEGICSSNKEVLSRIEGLLTELAEAYGTIFEESRQTAREFFGLRDFYSLVKMVYSFVASSNRDICWHQLEHAVKRNFGGIDDLDAVQIFKEKINTVTPSEEVHADDPDCSPTGLLRAALFGDCTDSESRYLLLLTENYGALGILQQEILDKHKVITIFGSSFPKDQEYTQVCRNINRIKVCMETGSTVILLNLENLYESLYDALNQYYARLGDARFVDLGLGTHRVKCRVHKNFRLIVVAEKQIVYEKFPIPLINRLEKHFLTLNNMMSPEQIKMARELHQWAEDFVTHRHTHTTQGSPQNSNPEDAFMGYHPDTTASIVLQVWAKKQESGTPVRCMFAECKELLLWCASPQYVLQLPQKKLYKEAAGLNSLYWKHQQHENIFQYLEWALEQQPMQNIQIQVTTHSKLLTDQEKADLARHLILTPNNIILLTLQSFDTEQQFAQQIKNFVQRSEEGQKLLLVQCGSGDRNQSLIRSAQYCVLDELPNARQFAVVFIIQLPNIAGGCFSGFQAGKWHSLHLDELKPQHKHMPTVEQLLERTPSSILKGIQKDAHSARAVKNCSIGEDVRHSVQDSSDLSRTKTFMTIEEGPKLVFGRQETEDDLEGCPVAPYFQNLLLPCIQSAAALIRDVDTKRSTKRIEILLKLLDSTDNEESEMFVEALSRLIISLLKEKEELMSYASSPKKWLFTEAAKSEEVQKAGTFRRAWILCLQNKITPVLAQVLAFLDNSRNLDFMHEVDVAPWTRRFWLALLNKTKICHDQCKRIVFQNKDDQNHFIVCKSEVTVELPFHWMLFHDVKTAVAQAEEMGKTRNNEDILNYVENIIRNTVYGEVLLSAVGEEEQAGVIKAYLKDFILSFYPGMSEHWKILCHALESAARQRGKDLDYLGVIRAVVYINVIHSAAKERLQLFLEVVQIWPEVVVAVTELKERVGGNPLLTDDEMTLDVLSLTLLMEQLEPSKDELNSDRGRSEWMDRVKIYLPVIGRILNTTDTDLAHGSVCLRTVDQARCGWMRVMTLKLFLESFTGNKKYQLETSLKPLWMMLKTESVLTNILLLEKVEKFLKSVNKAFEKEIAGKMGKCSHCDTQFGEALAAHLPCGDKVCLTCFADIKVTKSWKCPKCSAPIPSSYEPCNSSDEKRELLQDYRDYQKCCNTFLMAVVSKLCLSGNDAPERDVVQKIFSYITYKARHGQTEGRLATKQMSVFNDAFDSTPVVRSFLLQLLIRRSEETVQDNLQDFFLQAKTLCEQGGEERSQDTIDRIVQFSLLVIHCFEDLYHERASVCSPDEEMKMARVHLAEARQYIMVEELDMVKMFTVARCRYGLSVAAKFLHAVIVQKSLSQSGPFDQLIQEVTDLLDLIRIDWPKKFLVKQICREFGTDSYQTISTAARWLALDTTNEVIECPDRYLVCPLTYQKIREAVVTSLLGQKIKPLKSLVKNNEMLFLLGLHREITMKNINPSSEAHILQKSSCTITTYIQKAKVSTEAKELALKLLKNEFGRPGSPLNITEGQGVGDQSLVCLLLHTYLVLTHFNNKPGFLKPLSDLILHPENMADKFLPTMPQDDTMLYHEILLRSVKDADNTVKIFNCPNGHAYVITECGRPYTEGRCNKCGERIGGSRHTAFEGNTPHDGQDKTRPGHVLGRAADRTNAYAGERRLGGAACAVLRFFAHAALLLGAENNPQATAALVYPPLQQDVSQFFLEHLQKDLQIIHLATGKSVDDVLLLLHFICHQISQSDKPQRNDARNLTDKSRRENWEEEFSKTFISPPLQDLEACLETCNDRIRRDDRIGSNKLMSVLYEVPPVDMTTPQKVECLHEFPAVWKYRSRITVDHFLREFQLKVENKGKKSKTEVLSLFSQEHQHLQALHHVPNILHLQQLLIEKYWQRLDLSQACEMTITEISSTEDEGFKKDIQQLMPDLVAAWECVKNSLHGCWTVHDGLIHLPDAYKNMRIGENSPLAVLLPSTQGPGICSYMMLEFLFRKHNEFMESYCEKINSSYERLPEVSMRKLHSNHLVSYHPDRDLLPLVLANCNYSFELGKGTTIEYDFEGFEYQLKEVILQAKSRVEQKSHVIPIDQMVYRADSGNVAAFKTLQNRIPQEPLSRAVKLQIVSELKSSLPDVCDSINNLDITTSFLKSLGGEPDKPLQAFMTDVLKMKQTITSQKARQVCQFRHVQSLWLLLTFQKSVILAEHNQDPFSNLDSEHKVVLSEEERTKLLEFCERKSPDKLEFLLQEMFDCLLLWVAVPADNSDGPSPMSMGLKDLLQGHMDRSVHSDEGLGTRSSSSDQTLTEEDIDSLPPVIKGMHIPHTWLLLLQEITRRRKEM